MNNVLEKLIDDFHERLIPKPLPRHKSMSWITGKANVVIGMRRSGKTWFCYQKMRELLAQGVKKEQLLYLNFEDERLLPFSVEHFQVILETYYRKFPALKEQRCYLFLDEVQSITGWDKFVRRILDTEALFVCLTGSSSRLLSKEIATSLRGRSLTTEIFPFSFMEFLDYRKALPDSTRGFGSKTRAHVQNLIGQYLTVGGFPEIQDYDEDLRGEVLRNYLDVVILRDVVERHSVSNITALRALIRHILSAPAAPFSVNKFYHSLKSQGIACTKNNLYDYLDHLTDAFLFYQAPLHSRSEQARRVNPRKTYVVDSGLVEATSLRTKEDRGFLLENLVYMHMRRQGDEPEYYLTKNGLEVDFFLPGKGKHDHRLIQVCWNLDDPATREREVRALLTALDEVNVEKGVLVTWLSENEINERIEVVPAWKWLLHEEQKNPAADTETNR